MDWYCIYALTRDNGEIFYVGVSTMLGNRFHAHMLNFGKNIDIYIVDSIYGSKKQGFLLERKWIKSFSKAGYPLINRIGIKDPVKVPLFACPIDPAIKRQAKMFLAENGGSLRSLFEFGANYIITKGAQEYLKKIKK